MLADSRYSRYQTVLLKLEEIITALRRLSKTPKTQGFRGFLFAKFPNMVQLLFFLSVLQAGEIYLYIAIGDAGLYKTLSVAKLSQTWQQNAT